MYDIVSLAIEITHKFITYLNFSLLGKKGRSLVARRNFLEMSVNILSSIFVYVRYACHSNPSVEKAYSRLSSYVSIHCGSFQIYLLICVYHTEHPDHDTGLNFV